MAPEMVDWLEKKIGPPVASLSTLEDVESFIADNEVAVVGFFAGSGPEKEGYEQACLDYDDYGVHYPVRITNDADAIAKFGGKDGVVLFTKYDNGEKKYSGDYSVQSIRDFITEHALPNVIEFKDQVLFVSVDVAEEDHRRMLEFLGVRHRINNDTFPTMRIITMRDGASPVRFKPEDTTVSEENVRSFVSDYTAGKVPRDYFVEPLPADWNDRPAKYLTAVNLKQFIEDKKKHSLVMFYAPWCGHCKTLMPVWDQLAEKYIDSDVVVGKLDATVNEVEGVPPVNSFPTIKLFMKDGTQAEYNGERTVEGISKFIKTDGVYGMAAPDHDEL